MYKMLFNRRQLPRVEVQAPGKVVLAGNIKIDVTIQDLSTESVQLHCNSASQYMLFPYGASGTPGTPVRAGLYTVLPDTEESGQIFKAVCEVAICRRLSAQNYAIILHYRDIDPVSMRNLVRYMDARLRLQASLASELS